ncbi:MAG TPA: tRNA-guanine transglycosylase, partial [Thermoanaerobaculia bacterium]
MLTSLAVAANDRLRKLSTAVTERSFRVVALDSVSSARVGILSTAHAPIETPCFLPVGTRGAVKGVEFDRLEEWDCRAILANTYHLMARPGREIIQRAGGLHAFL